MCGGTARSPIKIAGSKAPSLHFAASTHRTKAPDQNSFRRGGGAPAGEAVFQSLVSTRAPFLHNMADQAVTSQRYGTHFDENALKNYS